MKMLKPYELFDAIKREFNLKNDAELARQLTLSPPQVSKFRARVIGCTDTLILRIHEVFGLTVPEIRDLAAKSVEQEAATDGAQ
jgi:plasmid maintenance system antidote protein VapI